MPKPICARGAPDGDRGHVRRDGVESRLAQDIHELGPGADVHRVPAGSEGEQAGHEREHVPGRRRGEGEEGRHQARAAAESSPGCRPRPSPRASGASKRTAAFWIAMGGFGR